MKELKMQVEMLALEELERANEKFASVFHTTHEGYAIIKEEIEEVETENKIMNRDLGDMWYNIKNNSVHMTRDNAVNLKVHAVRLAAEAVQVAAMAQKYIDSFTEKEC